MDTRCFNCDKLFGIVKFGNFTMYASSNINIVYDDPKLIFVEEIMCARCKKKNIKVVRGESDE